jgi:hypothetical protein
VPFLHLWKNDAGDSNARDGEIVADGEDKDVVMEHHHEHTGRKERGRSQNVQSLLVHCNILILITSIRPCGNYMYQPS